MEAIELAQKLRAEHGIQQVDYSDEWSILNYLRAKHRKFEDAKDRRRKEAEAFFAEADKSAAPAERA